MLGIKHCIVLKQVEAAVTTITKTNVHLLVGDMCCTSLKNNKKEL